jgi:glycosyltransferase involved in cell wall biosynthesis/LmbE family N-acetylglucosaminyl deacetylase
LESELLPYEAVASIPAKSVLVVAPHPDDEIFGCGGAIALHRQAGASVRVVLLTGGGLFGDPEMRMHESTAAATWVGSPSVECWWLQDRGLVSSEALIQRMADFIQAHDIDLVYAPSPWEIHPDHRQANQLIIESMQRIRHYARLAFYEVGAPLRPNTLLDITSVMNAKAMAMQCFVSQQAHQDFAGKIQSLNKYRTYSLPSHVQAAEAYWLLEPNECTQLAQLGMWAAVSPGLPIHTTRQSPLPLVSILIRSVGREQLTQALDSVALQTYPNIEVVVVAATSNHPDLPQRCGSYPLRFIKTDRQLMRSQAANTALSCAHGEFGLFLDDDDWLMPSHIARLANVLQTQPMAKAAYTGVSTVSADGSPLSQVFDIPFDAIRQRAQNLMPIHAVLFAMKTVRAICRFDEGLDLYEDWDFWMQVAKLGPMVHLPGVSAVYRIHASSGVHEPGGGNVAALNQMYRKWKSDLTDQEFSDLMGQVTEAGQLRERLSLLTASNSALNADLVAFRDQIEHHQSIINLIYSSLSWRLTAPLRRLSAAIKFGAFRQKNALRLAKFKAIKRSEGLSGVLSRINKRLGFPIRMDSGNYRAWLKKYAQKNIRDKQAIQIDIEQFDSSPLVSVIMPTYNTPLRFLKAAVDSVRTQIYPNWELCIADDSSSQDEVRNYLKNLQASDSRIKVTFRAVNGHISAASNDALSLACGEWVALLDHDDLLANDALYWVVKTLQTRADAGLIYSDEDKINASGERYDPYFKPDWSPELLLSQNYICHLSVFRRSLVTSVGGFRLGLEGAQDHDLILRCSAALKPHQIVHIPRILYHWRAIAGSTALALEEKNYANDAGVRAVSDFLSANNWGGEVHALPNGYYQVEPSLPEQLPWVTLIIPTRNAHELVRMCIESILDKTTYANYDILLVDNGSDNPESLAYFSQLSQHPRIQVVRDDREFNYSALNNAAVALAKGDIIGLVNNDIEIITPNWLQEMVGLALRPGVGAVGARLWYPNETLQHAGVVIGVGGVAGHAHLHRRRQDGGYFGRAQITQNFQAVTAACLLVRKAAFLQVGGLNEVNLKVAFNDVDFCLKLIEAGLRNVWTPFAEMYHHESATRGYENTPAKQARFASEVDYMHQRWGDTLKYDPSYNPNLSLTDAQFSLAFPPRLSA